MHGLDVATAEAAGTGIVDTGTGTRTTWVAVVGLGAGAAEASGNPGGGAGSVGWDVCSRSRAWNLLLRRRTSPGAVTVCLSTVLLRWCSGPQR